MIACADMPRPFATLLLLLLLATGCSSGTDSLGRPSDVRSASEREEFGAVEDWKLDRYCMVQDLQQDSRFVTAFGRETLAKADVLFIGAVVNVERGHMRMTSADVTVLQVLQGDIDVLDARTAGGASAAGVVRLNSPQADYFDRMVEGEHCFAVRRWRAGGFFECVSAFPIAPERRMRQIQTVLALIGIESGDDALVRRESARNAAMHGIMAEDQWEANVWSFQLANLCRDYATLFSERDFAALRQSEVFLLQNRPTAAAAIRGVTLAIVNLVRQRFKRDWVRSVRDGNVENRRRAANLLRDCMLQSWRAAWTNGDRAILETLRDRETDPDTRDALRDASLALQVILTPPEE